MAIHLSNVQKKITALIRRCIARLAARMLCSVRPDVDEQSLCERSRVDDVKQRTDFVPCWETWRKHFGRPPPASDVNVGYWYGREYWRDKLLLVGQSAKTIRYVCSLRLDAVHRQMALSLLSIREYARVGQQDRTLRECQSRRELDGALVELLTGLLLKGRCASPVDLFASKTQRCARESE